MKSVKMHIQYRYLSIFFLGLIFICSCTSKKDPIISEILDFSDQKYLELISNPKNEFQFIYTEIERTNKGVKFNSHRYNVDTTQYFYPASSVKLPVALMAIQKINEINLRDSLQISIHDNLLIDSIRVPQTAALLDSTTANNKPTIAQYIHKIFAISDNDAYNRLFEFVGIDYINNHLGFNGSFSNSRIRHRVSAPQFDVHSNKFCNPSLIVKNDSVIFYEDEKISERSHYPILNNTSKGKAYYVNDTLIEKPFDMSQKNFVNLVDYENILKRLFFPNSFSKQKRFNLTEEQLTFFQKSMAKTPRQHSTLNLDTDKYYDSYVKFFMFGDSKEVIPDHIKIHNKVGYAYGYLTDIAYIKDEKTHKDFFLLATVHVNNNQTFNDDNYEYEELGIPFLAELGRRVYTLNNKK